VNNITAWVPYTNTADYSVLLASRSLPLGFDGGTLTLTRDDGGGWGSFLNGVWNDAKRAAKRAAIGDVKAGAKAAMAAVLAGSPIVYEIVLAGAASGSIMAVLEL
jgi:hypothetical protein